MNAELIIALRGGAYLTSTEKFLALILASHDGGQGAYPSKALLVKELGCSRPTVFRTLRSLGCLGIVENVGETKQRTTIYRLNFPIVSTCGICVHGQWYNKSDPEKKFCSMSGKYITDKTSEVDCENFVTQKMSDNFINKSAIVCKRCGHSMFNGERCFCHASNTPQEVKGGTCIFDFGR